MFSVVFPGRLAGRFLLAAETGEMQAACVSAGLLHKGNQDNSSEPLREKII